MDWISRRRLTWQSLALVIVASGGCLAPGISTLGELSPALAVPPGPPVPSPVPSEAALLPDSEPLTWRAVSSEPEAPTDIATCPLPSNVSVPGGLEVCPLNSVLQLASGDSSPQTRDDAFKNLGLFGLTGMAQLLRRTGGPGSLHHVGDVTDDLLQPDDESAATKRVRPPFAFGLEWRY